MSRFQNVVQVCSQWANTLDLLENETEPHLLASLLQFSHQPSQLLLAGLLGWLTLRQSSDGFPLEFSREQWTLFPALVSLFMADSKKATLFMSGFSKIGNFSWL